MSACLPEAQRDLGPQMAERWRVVARGEIRTVEPSSWEKDAKQEVGGCSTWWLVFRKGDEKDVPLGDSEFVCISEKNDFLGLGTLSLFLNFSLLCLFRLGLLISLGLFFFFLFFLRSPSG